jgi:L-asparaginase
VALKVLPIHMGGTIGSVKTADGAKPGLSFSNILDSLRKDSNGERTTLLSGLAIGDVLTPLGPHGVHSSNIRIPHVQLLIQAVIDNYDNYDAFVVTHGTDTMAFTASMLSFALRNVKKPVIITGSQKLPEEAGSDALTNLGDAFAAAASGIGGIWLVFNGQVINGVRASKVDTQLLDAFVSIRRDEKSISEFLTGHNMDRGDEIFSSHFSTDVDIFYLSQTITAESLQQYLAIRNPQALIILVYGLGGQCEYIWDVLGEWVKSGHMVIAKSQCVFGETNLNKYAVGRQAAERGILSASNMSLETCFAKLSYMLGNSITDPAFFHQNIIGELLE